MPYLRLVCSDTSLSILKLLDFGSKMFNNPIEVLLCLSSL